jgi:hypothetical protein
LLCVIVRDTNRLGEAQLDALSKPFRDALDGLVRVNIAVDLVQIDLVYAEASQGILEAANNAYGEPSPREERDGEPGRSDRDQVEDPDLLASARTALGCKARCSRGKHTTASAHD